MTTEGPTPLPSLEPNSGLEQIVTGLENFRMSDNDLLQQLAALLTAERNSSNSNTTKAIKWPEWDGAKDSYSLFKWTIKSKIKQEKEKLGSNEAICTNIFTGLLKDKQL